MTQGRNLLGMLLHDYRNWPASRTFLSGKLQALLSPEVVNTFGNLARCKTHAHHQLSSQRCKNAQCIIALPLVLRDAVRTRCSSSMAHKEPNTTALPHYGQSAEHALAV
jgi:hypothetical protein